MVSESEGKVDAKWWVVTTPDSFSGGKSMLAQPCTPLPRVDDSTDCKGNLRSDERRNVGYTRGVFFDSIHELWECFDNNGSDLAEPWLSHYNCVWYEDPSYIKYFWHDCRQSFPRVNVHKYGLSTQLLSLIHI